MIEWFEDLSVGMRYKSPQKLVTREDIKRFAAEFDPQPYHLDEAAAERTLLPPAGIRRQWRCDWLSNCGPLGPILCWDSASMNLRWPTPVRPGDVIHLEGEVIELTPSKTKPQGTVRVRWTAFNQHGVPMYTFTPFGPVPRRPSE